MLSRGIALVLACQLVVLLGTAGADDKSGKQKRADQLFQEGRALLAKGDNNAGAACDKFSEAIRLDPEAPGTMLNLGLCNELLRKYKTALYWFRKAQARAAETNLPAYEQAAKDHTIDLKQNKVATIRISFVDQPEGTRVKIDGEEVAPADYLAVEVDPGDHTLTAGAPGHKNFEQPFTVIDRGGQTLMIELVVGDNAIVVDRGAGRRKAAIITAAGGGVLMLGSLVVSLVAKSRYNDCADNGALKLEGNVGCGGRTPDEAKDYANDQKRLAEYWGTGLFIAGAATVGVAAVLYFTAPEKERIDRTVFVPTLGPSDVGFAVGGRF
jgi:hypothetical protein